MDPSGLDVVRLARSLDVLATPARLRLLALLRTPRTAAEIILPAGDERGQMRAERALARTTVIHHLTVLESERLIVKDEATGKYVLDRSMLFLVTHALGDLARLEPFVRVEPTQTLRREAPSDPVVPQGRRMLHVGGPMDGQGLGLAGVGPWILGRAPDVDLVIAYDPQVSRRQARIRADPEGRLWIGPVPEATNPLFVNGAPVVAEVPLEVGSVLAVGATRLVYQR